MDFRHGPLSVKHPSAGKKAADSSSSDGHDGDVVPTEFAVFGFGNEDRTGIACSEARIGHLVYEFDGSDVGLIVNESGGGLDAVGEAILHPMSDYGHRVDAPPVQKFLLDTLDLLALGRRCGQSGYCAMNPSTQEAGEKPTARSPYGGPAKLHR